MILMALKDEGVRLVIENLGGFLQGIGKYNTAIGKAEKATQRFGESAGRAGRGLALLGAPIAAFGAASVKAAVTFDTALVGVAKTTNATEAELEILGREFRQMALEIPVAAAELANIGEIAGRLGVQAGDISAFTETVAALGVATDLTTESAAEFLARIQAITQLPADEIENFSSSLVALGNNLAASESEIALFAIRMAGAGDVAGLTQAEILGIAGSFRELGIRAERGGTAVQKVLFTMIEAINTASPELQTFAQAAGLTAQEFATLFEKDAAEAFTRFVEGLGKSGDEAFQILGDLGLADQRLAQAFITLGNAGNNLRENIELGTEAFNENLALMTEAERRYASAASQFRILMNNATELAIVVGNALLPPLLDLIQIVTPLIQTFADFAEAHPLLTRVAVVAGLALVALGGALILIGAVAPGVVATIALTTKTIALMTPVVLKLIPAMAGLSISMGPITLIVLGISAAVVAAILIWKNWGTIVDFVKDRINNIISIINRLIDVLTIVNPLLGVLSLVGIRIPDIPEFGTGGIAGTTGAAIVGERGPEVVKLQAGAQVTPISRNNTFNVNANYTDRQAEGSIKIDMESLIMLAGS